MDDFVKARGQMVDCQLRPNDITDHDLLAAFLSVPREMFVPKKMQAIAYSDSDILLEEGETAFQNRYLMQVTPFAKMIQAADIRKNHVVLCVGCNTGYGAAILAMLSNSVVALDENADFIEHAGGMTSNIGIDNLAFVQGKLNEGLRSEAPYDVIILEGAVEVIPNNLLNQLKVSGRLVCVFGHGLSAKIRVYTKTETGFPFLDVANAAVPILPGFELERGFEFS